MDALKSKRRATGRVHAPFTTRSLQQARGTKTGDRIGYLHWLTSKNPARHRNPQRCITQMPDFHTIAPRDGPLTGGRLRRSRGEITLTLLYRQG